mgnify:CR=1 FL=1
MLCCETQEQYQIPEYCSSNICMYVLLKSLLQVYCSNLYNESNIGYFFILRSNRIIIYQQISLHRRCDVKLQKIIKKMIWKLFKTLSWWNIRKIIKGFSVLELYFWNASCVEDYWIMWNVKWIISHAQSITKKLNCCINNIKG